MNTPSLFAERELFAAGFSWVIGIDEVGRGAIAGPVAVGAAVITPDVDEFPAGLRDSKLLSQKNREKIHPRVANWVKYQSVACVDNTAVDTDGIVPSLARAGFLAVCELANSGVPLADTAVLLDGRHDWLSPALSQLSESSRPQVFTRIKADRDCAVVAAASVLAKVHRDRLMVQADSKYPGYALARNKGYGTAEHYLAISRLGQTPLHRSSWVAPR